MSLSSIKKTRKLRVSDYINLPHEKACCSMRGALGFAASLVEEPLKCRSLAFDAGHRCPENSDLVRVDGLNAHTAGGSERC